MKVAGAEVAKPMLRPDVTGLPCHPFDGRGFAAEVGMFRARISIDPVALARWARSSSALAMADLRYSVSRLISSSIKELNSQRRTHFPRLTVVLFIWSAYRKLLLGEIEDSIRTPLILLEFFVAG